MASQQTSPSISRRAALAGLGMSGLVLAAERIGASARGSGDLAGHPAVGAWLVSLPGAPGIPHAANVSVFFADGSVINMVPVSRMGPNGVTIASGGVGRWESTGEYTVRLTHVQLLSGPDGAYLGTLTIHGNPRISEDGNSFVDDSPDSYAEIRDPAGAIVMSTESAHARVAEPVTATRFTVDNPGFPEGTPAAATPTG
jgi:hypothetical protein